MRCHTNAARFVALAILPLLLPACGGTAPDEALAGSWRGELAGADIVLTFQPDGSGTLQLQQRGLRRSLTTFSHEWEADKEDDLYRVSVFPSGTASEFEFRVLAKPLDEARLSAAIAQFETEPSSWPASLAATDTLEASSRTVLHRH